MMHHRETSNGLDRGRHPALFQRVTRSQPPVMEQPERRIELPAAPRDILAAFAEWVQLRSAEIWHREHRLRPGSRGIWDFLEGRGFGPEDIQQLQFGIYPSAEEVNGFLRSAGFSDAAIADSGLVTDERGSVRHDWTGCLVLPLHDETGKIVDCLAVIPSATTGPRWRQEFARGAARTDVIAYGLNTALAASLGRKNLVLVEDILEALYLQCRGFSNVAAVGGDGREFSPRRWEELARLGVEAVTLAFGNDASRQRDVREALDHALRARTAPEVFVLERTQLLENETLADVARRNGLEACRKAASAKSLAFHAKDFGWSWPREAAPGNGHAAVPTQGYKSQYRAYLRAELDKLPPTEERAAIQGTIAEVETALYHRHFAHARAVLEAQLGNWRLARVEVRSQNVNAILDRLSDASGRSVIPEQLSRYAGNELQAGTLTVLANESLRGRLADLCSRLVTALETRGEEAWVVVCREFAEETIVLGLLAHMTRRMTTAQGLTFEEIHARLSGRDPLDGYSDKPWLVDEAVDRLRRWTDRLIFLTEMPDILHAADCIDRIAGQQNLGGVFFDSMSSVWQAEKSWNAGWNSGHSPAALLRELATQLSCAVVAMTDHIVNTGHALPTLTHKSPWRTPETNRAIVEFREMISYWIDQEERLEVRVA